MKKKILSIILVLSMLCAFMPVIANAADDMPIQMTTANITKSETDTTYNFDVAATENTKIVMYMQRFTRMTIHCLK